MTGHYEPDSTQVAAMEKMIGPNYLEIPNERRICFVKTKVVTKEGELFTDPDE